MELIPYLEARGFSCESCCLDDVKFSSLNDYDLVIIQKKLLTLYNYLKLKQLKVPIVFDLDDAIFFRDKPKSGSYESSTRQSRFNNVSKLVQGFICGNDYLASFCPDDKAKIVVSSSVPHEVVQKDYTIVNQPPIIGWVGSQSTLPMLENILEDLYLTNQKFPFELHVIADKKLQSVYDNFKIVNHIWTKESQEKIIASFDIGIMPLEETPWNKGKCAYKLLQYMASSVVAAGSDIGMNSELIKDNFNGVLIKQGQWQEGLLKLLKSPSLRKSLAEQGRKTILENYTFDKTADKLTEFFKQIAGSKVTS